MQPCAPSFHLMTKVRRPAGIQLLGRWRIKPPDAPLQLNDNLGHSDHPTRRVEDCNQTRRQGRHAPGRRRRGRASRER
jgi:hypothetical protein